MRRAARARRAWRALAASWALLTGCPTERVCDVEPLTPISAPRLAILTSDYSSSAVLLVDDDDGVIGPWIDSGTRPPELVAALSGDVVLPRAMPSRELLVVIDRYQTDVLTGIPYARPEDLFQVDLRGGRTSGASPNPQDSLALPDGRWLVSRFNAAEDPAAPELARGNDLAVLSGDGHMLEARIELGADVTIDGVDYLARPSGLARLGGEDGARVLVGLARLSPLAQRLTGPGAVALLDPGSETAQVLELEGLSNCGTVATIPDVDRPGTRALVLCRGDAFGEDEARAGIVELALEAGVIAVQRTFTPSRDPSMPSPGGGLVPLDETRAAYVSEGSLAAGRRDRLVVIDLTSGHAQVIGESTRAFELGQGALEQARDLLHVPDGAMRAVRRFDTRTLEEQPPLTLEGPCLPLPPRQVVVLR